MIPLTPTSNWKEACKEDPGMSINIKNTIGEDQVIWDRFKGKGYYKASELGLITEDKGIISKI